MRWRFLCCPKASLSSGCTMSMERWGLFLNSSALYPVIRSQDGEMWTKFPSGSIQLSQSYVKSANSRNFSSLFRSASSASLRSVISESAITHPMILPFAFFKGPAFNSRSRHSLSPLLILHSDLRITSPRRAAVTGEHLSSLKSWRSNASSKYCSAGSWPKMLDAILPNWAWSCVAI